MQIAHYKSYCETRREIAGTRSRLTIFLENVFFGLINTEWTLECSSLINLVELFSLELGIMHLL